MSDSEIAPTPCSPSSCYKWSTITQQKKRDLAKWNADQPTIEKEFQAKLVSQSKSPKPGPGGKQPVLITPASIKPIFPMATTKGVSDDQWVLNADSYAHVARSLSAAGDSQIHFCT